MNNSDLFGSCSDLSTAIHLILDKIEIPHFIHSIYDDHILIYVDDSESQNLSIECFSKYMFFKSILSGIDEDDDCWIELFF